MGFEPHTRTESGFICWLVLLHSRWIDTVYFEEHCNRDYVTRSLIEHDRYNPNIVVRRSAR